MGDPVLCTWKLFATLNKNVYCTAAHTQKNLKTVSSGCQTSSNRQLPLKRKKIWKMKLWAAFIYYLSSRKRYFSKPEVLVLLAKMDGLLRGNDLTFILRRIRLQWSLFVSLTGVVDLPSSSPSSLFFLSGGGKMLQYFYLYLSHRSLWHVTGWHFSHFEQGTASCSNHFVYVGVSLCVGKEIKLCTML